jgi:hypothetical protein
MHVSRRKNTVSLASEHIPTIALNSYYDNVVPLECLWSAKCITHVRMATPQCH